MLAVALVALGAALPARAESSSWEPGTEITTKRALRIFTVRAAAQCRDACLANGRCVAWNFEPSSAPRRRARHRCELFARVEGKRPARGRSAASTVAGVKRAADPSAADKPDRAKNATPSPAQIADAGVAKGAGALPSARELARARKRAAALRAAAVEEGVRQAASAIDAESSAARDRAALRDIATLDAVKAGASTLPSEQSLARLRREVARERQARITDAVEKGAAALPSEQTLARLRREAARERIARVADGVEKGAAVLPSPASLARMRRETSALIASIETAVVETSASALSAAAARQEMHAATMTAGVSEGASRLAAEAARAQKNASAARAASPAARPSAKEGSSPDRPRRPPEQPPAASARRSTWEPGISLAGSAFAFDDAGANAGYQTPDAQACRDLCLRHAPCGGWKHTGRQYPHPDLRNICFLFSRGPSRFQSGIVGVVSGVVSGSR